MEQTESTLGQSVPSEVSLIQGLMDRTVILVFLFVLGFIAAKIIESRGGDQINCTPLYDDDEAGEKERSWKIPFPPNTNVKPVFHPPNNGNTYLDIFDRKHKEHISYTAPEDYPLRPTNRRTQMLFDANSDDHLVYRNLISRYPNNNSGINDRNPYNLPKPRSSGSNSNYNQRTSYIPSPSPAHSRPSTSTQAQRQISDGIWYTRIGN